MKTDAQIIHDLGGPADVARRLGFENGGTQRVQNWIKRGIPAEVKLNRPDLFLPSWNVTATQAHEPQHQGA